MAAKPELHVLTFTSGNCLDILQKFHSIKALLPPLEEISSIAFPFSVFRKDNMTRIIKPTFYKFRRIILTYLFTNCLLSQVSALVRNDILLPKLFWPTVRKKCSSDWEKHLKFEDEGRKFLVKECFFNLFLEVSHI